MINDEIKSPFNYSLLNCSIDKRDKFRSPNINKKVRADDDLDSMIKSF